jgi:hypothetical protein
MGWKPKDIEKLNKQLLDAAHHGNIDKILDLTKRGADLTYSDQNGWNALFKSVNNGKFQAADLLIKMGISIESRDMGQYTPLMWAVFQGHINTVKYLVEQNADLNATNHEGTTPLMIGANKGFREIVEFLLDSAADPNLFDKYDHNAWAWANKGGHTQVADLIKQRMKQDQILTQMKEYACGRVVSFWPRGSMEFLPDLAANLPPQNKIIIKYPEFHKTIETFFGQRARPSSLEYCRNNFDSFNALPGMSDDLCPGKVSKIYVWDFKASMVFSFMCRSLFCAVDGKPYDHYFDFVMPRELGERCLTQVLDGNRDILDKAYKMLFPLNSKFNPNSFSENLSIIRDGVKTETDPSPG